VAGRQGVSASGTQPTPTHASAKPALGLKPDAFETDACCVSLTQSGLSWLLECSLDSPADRAVAEIVHDRVCIAHLIMKVRDVFNAVGKRVTVEASVKRHIVPFIGSVQPLSDTERHSKRRGPQILLDLIVSFFHVSSP
jgi:hypothetical protein